MPRRQHEDSPYDPYEGRFEGREDPSWREQSNRGSRDWERRADDFRNEGREEYRGGPRYGEQRYGGPQNWDERRESQPRFGQRDWGTQGPYAQQPGPYGQHSGYASGHGQQGGSGQDWHRQGYGGQQGDYGGWQGASPGWERSQGHFPRNFHRDHRSDFGGYRYDRPDYSREQSNYGARDQYEPFGREREREWRGGEGRFESRDRDESWTDQVRHTGRQFATRVKRAFRGPKGYKRSDERIREDVSERLAQQDELDPSDIEVRVSNGEVTLTGTVRSRHEKFLAEEISDEVLGVNDVHVQLRVRRDQDQNAASGTSSTGPSDISRNARA